MKLQGIFPAITTPFDHTGDIYKTKVQHNVEKWNRLALAGYVVCGTAGEGMMLSADEKTLVWELVAKYAGPDRLPIAAIGVDGVREAVALANRTADLGYKAALIQPPRYGSPLAFFRAVADRSKVPVILDGCAEPEIVPLSQHPNIAAAGASAQQIKSLKEPAGAGFQWLARSAADLWEALQSGATGAVTGFASAAPYACIALWEAHRTREEEAGIDWQARITHPAELASNSVAALKYAMDLNGYYGGPPRLPFLPLTMKEKQEIENAFGDLKG